MAKAKRGEKSAAVRDYIGANSAATVAEIVDALKAKGLSVSKQMVSNIKIKMSGGKSKRGRKKKRKGGRKAMSATTFSLDILVQAKKLADQLGGVAKAKEAMDALAKLQ